MKFSLRKPCKECPFLRGQSYLYPARAREIGEAVMHGDVTFTCHKHLHGAYRQADFDDNEACSYKADMNDQHCAGALLMIEKTGAANAMVQIAERLGLYDPQRLEHDHDVYLSPDEMAEGHARHVDRPERVRAPAPE